jgi:hypothetical protein
MRVFGSVLPREQTPRLYRSLPPRQSGFVYSLNPSPKAVGGIAEKDSMDPKLILAASWKTRARRRKHQPFGTNALPLAVSIPAIRLTFTLQTGSGPAVALETEPASLSRTGSFPL